MNLLIDKKDFSILFNEIKNGLILYDCLFTRLLKEELNNYQENIGIISSSSNDNYTTLVFVSDNERKVIQILKFDLLEKIIDIFCNGVFTNNLRYIKDIPDDILIIFINETNILPYLYSMCIGYDFTWISKYYNYGCDKFVSKLLVNIEKFNDDNNSNNNNINNDNHDNKKKRKNYPCNHKNIKKIKKTEQKNKNNSNIIYIFDKKYDQKCENLDLKDSEINISGRSIKYILSLIDSKQEENINEITSKILNENQNQNENPNFNSDLSIVREVIVILSIKSFYNKLSEKEIESDGFKNICNIINSIESKIEQKKLTNEVSDTSEVSCRRYRSEPYKFSEYYYCSFPEFLKISKKINIISDEFQSIKLNFEEEKNNSNNNNNNNKYVCQFVYLIKYRNLKSYIETIMEDFKFLDKLKIIYYSLDNSFVICKPIYFYFFKVSIIILALKLNFSTSLQNCELSQTNFSVLIVKLRSLLWNNISVNKKMIAKKLSDLLIMYSVLFFFKDKKMKTMLSNTISQLIQTTSNNKNEKGCGNFNVMENEFLFRVFHDKILNSIGIFEDNRELIEKSISIYILCSLSDRFCKFKLRFNCLVLSPYNRINSNSMDNKYIIIKIKKTIENIIRIVNEISSNKIESTQKNEENEMDCLDFESNFNFDSFSSHSTSNSTFHESCSRENETNTLIKNQDNNNNYGDNSSSENNYKIESDNSSSENNYKIENDCLFFNNSKIDFNSMKRFFVIFGSRKHYIEKKNFYKNNFLLSLKPTRSNIIKIEKNFPEMIDENWNEECNPFDFFKTVISFVKLKDPETAMNILSGINFYNKKEYIKKYYNNNTSNNNNSSNNNSSNNSNNSNGNNSNDDNNNNSNNNNNNSRRNFKNKENFLIKLFKKKQKKFDHSITLFNENSIKNSFQNLFYTCEYIKNCQLKSSNTYNKKERYKINDYDINIPRLESPNVEYNNILLPRKKMRNFSI